MQRFDKLACQIKTWQGFIENPIIFLYECVFACKILNKKTSLSQGV
jgi:hypothetical protein